MHRYIFIIAVCLGLASPALGEEILYCTDTMSSGIIWKDGKPKVTAFKGSRFTVKVISETKRVIVYPESDPVSMKCWLDFRRVLNCGTISLTGNVFMDAPITFFAKNFTRALLDGPPMKKGETATSNIYVAYGTCTKF